MKLELEDTKTEVVGSQVLFPVAKNDSFLLDFVKENSIKKSAGLREENIIAIKNFCPSCLIVQATSCQNKKLLLILETLH